jgi:hypothetical protein
VDESRHAPTMCTVSPPADTLPDMCIESSRARFALSARVRGARATCTAAAFLGTGTDPLAHCAGTVNPDTESRLSDRELFAASAAREARASLAF